MTQFRTEGQPAFPTSDTGNDNPADSSTVDSTDVKSDEEKNDTAQTQSQEGDTNSGAAKDGGDENFADNPRWQEREANWNDRYNKQELRHADEMKKFSEDFNKKLEVLAPKSKSESEDADETPPDWFGGDEAEWAKFNKWNNAKLEKAQDAALSKVQAERGAEQKRIDDATQYFRDEVAAIEADRTLNPKGIKLDRATQDKLLQKVLDRKLLDDRGRWNYRAAWEIINITQSAPAPAKPNLADRKNLANATTKDKGGETKPPAFMTSEDLKGKNWSDLP